MKQTIAASAALIFLFGCQNQPQANTTQNYQPQVDDNKFNPSQWQLAWQDEFDGPDAELEQVWDVQNSPSGHILSSRWRENVKVGDGVLYLQNRKEKRGGQDWTSGSIRTKEQFGYGYYEARYKYAASNGTNNSFWLMTYPLNQEIKKGKKFEIDINEGHYPNEVNTNIHNWSDITTRPDGRKTHPSDSRTKSYGAKPEYKFPLEIPVTTQKIRFISNDLNYVHLRDFSVYGLGGAVKGKNLALDKQVRILTSGQRNAKFKAQNMLGPNSASWTSQLKGDKWVVLEWPEEKTIEEIHFANGWSKNNKGWAGLTQNFKLQYYKNGQWHDVASLDVENDVNFADEYHTWGLEWNEQEIVFYFDGKEIRREKNEFAHSPSPIWLSLAIIKWDGPVTDKINGTSMKVDYVRYYKKVADAK
ncbi:glycoside hydrolase family 16 protein [Gayadomonas joobiniege]|uniref:glycoside hydrolase family 16 protein n=1 Tax=Gayadomonas joobiniege TaxID=1234606 RepID=UPI00037974B5|nr:family 16 glycosylhydrolase [Gayadomonas joobiniege]